MSTVSPNALGHALRGFFSEYLPRVRGASPHTVLSYRDAFVLLLRFLATHHNRPIVLLDFEDLTVDDVLAFLDHLEVDRRNSVATRNARLAAVHAFARYAAAGNPGELKRCQRLLSLPFKRGRLRIIEYLNAQEIDALLAAPDRGTVEGRRDYALLLTMFNTGARVQEIVDLRPCDIQLVRPFQVRLRGKGRKERICPLMTKTAEALKALMLEIRTELNGMQPLFRNRRGEPLTRFGVRYLLRKHALRAQASAPSLAAKRVHPHVVRHSTAVHFLQAGVDMVTISHWLGHASIETTNRYIAIDIEMKRAALAKAGPLGEADPSLGGWRSDASILDWLEAL